VEKKIGKKEERKKGVLRGSCGMRIEELGEFEDRCGEKMYCDAEGFASRSENSRTL